MTQSRDIHSEGHLDFLTEPDAIKCTNRVTSFLRSHNFNMNVCTRKILSSLSSSRIRKLLYLLPKLGEPRRDTTSKIHRASDTACKRLVAKENEHLPAKLLREAQNNRRTTNHIYFGVSALLMFGGPISVYLLNQPLRERWYELSVFSTPCVSENLIIPSGFQGLLTVDVAYGDMAFSLAKFIDMVWDIVVGRGGQLLIAWIDYRVFSDALMQIMETTPVPYGLFIEMTFSPPSVATLRPIMQVLSSKTSWHHRSLFLWLLLNVLWVTSYAMIVSAMTGYAAKNYAIIRLFDGSYVNATTFQIADEV